MLWSRHQPFLGLTMLLEQVEEEMCQVPSKLPSIHTKYGILDRSPNWQKFKPSAWVHFLLDIGDTMSHKLMSEEYSISKTAKLLLVHRSTLHRWISAGVIPKPIEKNIAGSRLRYWDGNGFLKVKEYREKHFGEGQGERTDLKKKRMKKAK